MADARRPGVASGVLPDPAYDVVVVGSGGGGLTAAVVAASKGLRVAVLEKADVFGGTTAISAGGVWIPGNPAARRAGVSDTREDAMAYFRHCAGVHFDQARVEALLDQGPAMLAYLEEHAGLVFNFARGRPDYHPGAPGAALEGRTIHPQSFDARELGREVARLRPPLREMTVMGLMIKPGPDLKHFLNALRSLESARFVARRMLRHARDVIAHGRAMDLSNGNALVARLAKSLFDRGGRIFTSTAVTSLVSVDGRVAGVRYRAAGKEGTITARLGVVLAAGGFPHDVERRAALYSHAPTGAEHWSANVSTNTGDGVRMAEAAGAHVDADLAHAAGWAPVSLVPQRGGTTVTFAHLIDRQKPGFIAVTRGGERFVNEADSYHDFGKALIAARRDGAPAEAFLIADRRALRRYGMGAVKPAPFPIGAHLRSGYLLQGKSLRELAARAGIDAATLERTVATFNAMAREGCDPAFGRGDNAYNRYNGDQAHAPNPCLAPLERPPFYAMRIVIGDLATFAGLATDAHARVLDKSGAPIPGLYAAGNDAANAMGGDYMGGGATIGPGMTWGYVAACTIAAGAPAAMQER